MCSSTSNQKDIVNNLARSLIDRLEVKIGDKIVQDIYDYDIWRVYTDLWLTKEDRKRAIQQGIDDTGMINRNRISDTDVGDPGQKMLQMYMETDLVYTT